MCRLVASEAGGTPEVADTYLADSWDSNIAIYVNPLAWLDRRGAVTIIGRRQLRSSARGPPSAPRSTRAIRV